MHLPESLKWFSSFPPYGLPQYQAAVAFKYRNYNLAPSVPCYYTVGQLWVTLVQRPTPSWMGCKWDHVWGWSLQYVGVGLSSACVFDSGPLSLQLPLYIPLSLALIPCLSVTLCLFLSLHLSVSSSWSIRVPPPPPPPPPRFQQHKVRLISVSGLRQFKPSPQASGGLRGFLTLL